MILNRHGLVCVCASNETKRFLCRRCHFVHFIYLRQEAHHVLTLLCLVTKDSIVGMQQIQSKMLFAKCPIPKIPKRVRC